MRESNPHGHARRSVPCAATAGKGFGHPGPHDTSRGRRRIGAVHAGGGDDPIEGRNDHPRAGYHVEEMRAQRVRGLGAQEPLRRERRQQISGLEFEAAGDLGRPDLAGESAGRGCAEAHLRERTERFGGSDVGLAGEPGGDKGHHDGERHRDETGPQRNLKNLPHEGDAARRQPEKTGRNDRGDDVLSRERRGQYRVSENAAEQPRPACAETHQGPPPMRTTSALRASVHVANELPVSMPGTPMVAGMICHASRSLVKMAAKTAAPDSHGAMLAPPQR